MKKIILKIFVTLLVSVITLNAFSMVYASSEKEQLKKKIQETNKNLNEVNSQKQESEGKVEDLSSKIKEYESKISSLSTEIEKKTKEVNEMQKQLDSLEKEKEKNQQLLNERLVVLYESGQTSYMDLLLSSSDLSQFISSYYMIETLTSADKELIQNLENDKKEIESTQKKLNSNLEEIQNKKTEQENVQAQLNKAKNQEQTKVDKLTEQSHDLEEDVDEYQKKMQELDAKEKAEEEAVRKEFEKAKKANAERQKNEATSKNNNSNDNSSNNNGSNNNKNNNNSNSNDSNYSNSGNSSTSSKGFIRPVKSGTITTRMYYSSGKFHGAVDFGVPVGTPVYAAADGMVVTATWGGSDSYGYYIKIKHYNGLYTLYAHGSSLRVSVGQTVKKGDLIMLSGSTGNSTGPHLHFEVRNGAGGYNNRVNPLNYLP